jgi:hypothetical protein
MVQDVCGHTVTRSVSEASEEAWYSTERAGCLAVAELEFPETKNGFAQVIKVEKSFRIISK